MKFRPKSEDSRNFLKLKPGENVQGIFRGELYEFRIHWAENRSTLCLDKNTCEICKSGQKSKFRFRVNFIMKEGGEYAAKVVEQGWTFYETLRTLNEGDYQLEKNVMKITRQGSGLTTSYTVIPVPNGFISSETEQKLAAVKLNELGHITESETEPIDANIIPSIDDEDIPF